MFRGEIVPDNRSNKLKSITYEFLGYVVKITTADDTLYKASTKNYAICFRMLSGREKTRKADISISLFIGRRSPKIPGNFKKIGEVSGKLGVHRCYSNGSNLLYIEGKNTYLTGNLKKGSFSAYLSSPRAGSMPIFLTALALFMQSKGLFVLHTAIVAKQKKVFLLAGESGVGKTTLGINLIKRDFFYLTDDSCLLSRLSNGRIGAFMLPNDPTPKFNVIRNNLIKSKGLPKDIIGTCRKMHFPDFIIFPTIAHLKKSKLVPLSMNETIIRLIQLSQLMWLEDKRTLSRHINVLKGLSKQCRCFKLLAGRDRKEVSKTVADILNSKKIKRKGPL